MKHFTVIFKPTDRRINIHCGASILEAASQAGIILNTVCGGAGICRKCAVTIEPTGQEVLACQYHIQNDLTVFVPAESSFFHQKILQHGIDRQIKTAPAICKKLLAGPLKNLNDLESALKACHPDHIHRIGPSVAGQLDRLGPQAEDTGITAVLHRTAVESQGLVPTGCYECLCLEAGDTTANLFGIAVDIGTTTVVAKLIDMHNGRTIAADATTNPQIVYGDDVISRIACGETEDGLKKLHDSIIKCLNELIDRLCRDAQINAAYIYEIAVAGNTTMNHLFLKLPVKQLGQAPYKAYSTTAHDRSAAEMGVNINPCGNIHTIENIAGFVGSDTTAVALAVGIDSVEQTTLVVDIGTNGELILAADGRLYAASCAAGPALEGARIKQGGRAAEGAIERVVIAGDDIDLDVIGGTEPRSICGSGLIDAVAVLLDLGLIDQTGRFVQPDELKAKVAEPILNRLTDCDGQPAFILAHNKNNTQQLVLLTQRDVRETQLAKAAIRAGIRLLAKKAGIEDGQIEQILLAGAFGNYIQRQSARRIGLLPDVELEKIHFVGNAAASGAEMVLLSSECRQSAGELTEKIEYVEIAHQSDFQSIFADSLMFAETGT